MAKPWEGERLHSHRMKRGCFSRSSDSCSIHGGGPGEPLSESRRRGSAALDFPASGETSHPPTASRRAPPSLYERGGLHGVRRLGSGQCAGRLAVILAAEVGLQVGHDRADVGVGVLHPEVVDGLTQFRVRHLLRAIGR